MSLGTGFLRWMFAPTPLARIAIFRVVAYLFIPVDVFVSTRWVAAHAAVPTDYYQPLLIGEWLPLPTPTSAVVNVVKWLLIGSTLLAATGKAPRIWGTTTFLLYFEWMVIAMSYGKVDHDRYAFLVALAVLPTVGVARWRDHRRSEAAGFAVGVIFIAVTLTYFLASWAKIRFGGWDWVNGATLTRAVLRRGTDLSNWSLDVPGLLHVSQYLMIGFELLSPLMLFVRRDRARIALVVFLLGFHLMVFAGVRIIFLPHVVAILSILAWERLRRRSSRPEAIPRSDDQAVLAS
ncbi:MAG: MFS transporter permease [Geodermatophilaceae bacterium]|nr:MFS transporter permease [Geodermatophilaceae bacterium]